VASSSDRPRVRGLNRHGWEYLDAARRSFRWQLGVRLEFELGRGVVMGDNYIPPCVRLVSPGRRLEVPPPPSDTIEQAIPPEKAAALSFSCLQLTN
jgi:hypothetical protein